MTTPLPITRLLVANRGEIAVRIARTARRLGMGTVGVYSEPDANALHVDSVDVAVALGGVTAADSYLRGDAIIAAALNTGCDAVHPGYGFLAENPAFAQQVQDAGLTWVGPTPQQITLLGNKVAAKQAAVEAGVPTAPVFAAAPGDVPNGIPMPALVKAAAGGGGRGMRVVRSANELSDAIDAASREALAAFGDGTVFIEPYLEHGRHVEVQIMGDSHGNVIHLGERECSIQRRNQKVVEEAPSAGITAEVRTVLLQGALALAQHVGYQNAGTVEFLVGANGTINFLEVNTRLQVEHPVTEAVTGLDLVELQLLVAAGQALPLTQDQVTVSGHAIEVRVVAEDPATGWLPSTGTIDQFQIPSSVRVDSGFRTGDTVSPNYDSLLAKVIAHAPTRAAAAGRLRAALQASQIAGVHTNLNTLAAIMAEPDFLTANTPTSYLDAHPAALSATGPQGDDRVALLLGAVFAKELQDVQGNTATGFAPSGWRNLRTQGERQTWSTDTSEEQVEYVMTHSQTNGPSATVWLGPWPVPAEDGTLSEDSRRQAHVRLLRRSPLEQVLELDGQRHLVTTRCVEDQVFATTPSGALAFTLAPRFTEHTADLAGSGPICPLPGTVLSVLVEAGQQVNDGDLLMVVEAMKMEHQIAATAAATVTAVHFATGDRVDSGDLLVSLEAADDQ